jgi:hypothetical protein
VIDSPSHRDRQPGGGVVGFVFGLILGAAFVAWLADYDDFSWWMAAIPIAIALIGARWGDRFWYWFIHLWGWHR